MTYQFQDNLSEGGHFTYHLFNNPDHSSPTSLGAGLLGRKYFTIQHCTLCLPMIGCLLFLLFISGENMDSVSFNPQKSAAFPVFFIRLLANMMVRTCILSNWIHWLFFLVLSGLNWQTYVWWLLFLLHPYLLCVKMNQSSTCISHYYVYYKSKPMKLSAVCT